MGLANPGVLRVRDEFLPWAAERLTRARVLVSIVGFTIEEYGHVIGELDGTPGITGVRAQPVVPEYARRRD